MDVHDISLGLLQQRQVITQMHNSALTQLKQQFHRQKAITRFAPSPTGHLHLGHIASAYFVWGIAKIIDGKINLRIEDHDRGRSRAHYVHSIKA